MSGDMTEIARLDEKINIFMGSQNEVNSNINRNLEKLTDAMSQMQVQQTEINNLVTSADRLSAKVDKIDDRIDIIEQNQAVSNEFRKQVIHMKWVVVGAGVSIFVYIVKEFLS